MLEQGKRQPIWKTIRKGVTKMNGGKKSLSLLTAIQIIFFGVVLVAAFVIKLLGGSIYETVQSWYTGELNDSVLADQTPGKRGFVGVVHSVGFQASSKHSRKTRSLP